MRLFAVVETVYVRVSRFLDLEAMETLQCAQAGCSTRSSHGVVGTKNAEICPKHARVGMVKVVNTRFKNDGCSGQPSRDAARSETAEFCVDRARTGMFNVVSKKCDHDGCFIEPSYGFAGSRKAEFCVGHARTGMVMYQRTSAAVAVAPNNHRTVYPDAIRLSAVLNTRVQGYPL